MTDNITLSGIYPSLPFHDPAHGDIVLRSSDNVLFYTSRNLLSYVSPIFRGLFSAPVSDAGPAQAIPLPEESSQVERMLRLCYPCLDVEVKSLEEVQSLLQITRNYQMEAGFTCARRHLVGPNFLQDQPHRVYAIAYGYRLEYEAKLAAQHALDHPSVMPLVAELQHLPVDAYHHLAKYRSRCGEAVSSLTDAIYPLTFGVSWVWATCTTCQPGPYTILPAGSHIWRPRLWFAEYFELVRCQLRTRASSRPLLDPAFLQPALQRADQCSYCRCRASQDLHKYASQVGLLIQNVLSEVDLEIGF